ncbi:hypothetical protein F4680DRAFT_21659 [Xylaria scruposa]|nr:hypothetical protein F4680DRAFT_21659 [Xylaria scruposa]
MGDRVMPLALMNGLIPASGWGILGTVALCCSPGLSAGRSNYYCIAKTSCLSSFFLLNLVKSRSSRQKCPPTSLNLDRTRSSSSSSRGSTDYAYVPVTHANACVYTMPMRFVSGRRLCVNHNHRHQHARHRWLT